MFLFWCFIYVNVFIYKYLEGYIVKVNYGLYGLFDVVLFFFLKFILFRGFFLYLENSSLFEKFIFVSRDER